MEELASGLLSTLKRSSAPVETKLSLLNSLKSSIKHQRIPESAQPATIECIRIAITTQTSSTLVAAGFATLTHLIKRLAIQEEVDVLFAPRLNILALLLEKLGDLKDAHRQAASQALCDLWPVRHSEVEKLVREGAIQGANVRAKEAGVEWVTKMHALHELQFRNFVGPIVECLEDADGSVRDCAKANILELFRNARDAAKADLKRQLLAYNVRQSITSHLLSQLQIPTPAEAAANASTNSLPRQAVPPQNHTSADAMIDHNSSTAESAPVEPLYVQSQRELEDMFQQMQPCFEGREGDDNWKPRDLNTTKLRRLLQGNCISDYHQAFVAGIKTMLDGILKVANSLRTTLATNGCSLIQELTKTLGVAIDSMIDTILQGLEKMSASTKHINGLNAYATIDTIFANVPYHVRLMQHIWHASQDKNVQPRTFASGWLKTMLKRQMQHKAQFEHSGGLELADKAIRKCLGDANPKSRENMRSTYWFFAQAWPSRAEAIMASLDPKSKQLLEKDPGNPNASHAAAATAFTSSVGPVSAPNPRAAPSSGRSSLKDTIAAQKKAALAAKRIPERPNSAMSSFSPVKQQPPSAVRPAPLPASSHIRNAVTVETQPLTRPPLISAASGSGLLSSAPLRRPRRPDMPRPATADLYSSRRAGRTDTPPRSPVVSPARSLASSVSSGQMGFTAATRPTVASQARATLEVERTIVSPRLSPSRLGQRTPMPPTTINKAVAKPPAVTRVEPASPTPSPDENFTIVIPRNGSSSRQILSPRSRTESGRSIQTRLSLPTMVEEDNFTLVMPQIARLESFGSPIHVHARMLSIAEDQTSSLTKEEVALPAGQTATFDFAAGAPTGVPHHEAVGVEVASLSDDLIIFEDPTIENIVIPFDQIESSRNALEELHSNALQTQLQFDEPAALVSASVSGEHERPKSPQKKVVPVHQPIGDRRETPKGSRSIKGYTERLRNGTLTKEDFQALLELIENGVSHQAEELGKLYADVLAAIVQRSRGNDAYRSTLYDGEKMAEAVLEKLGDDAHACLDHLIGQDWQQYSTDRTAHGGTLAIALSVMGKLVVKVTTNKGELNLTQRTQLCALALRALSEVEAEVRRAAVNFCLQLYDCFGREHHGEFWRSLSKAGDAQLNLIAYYMARSGNFVAPVEA